MSTITPSGHYHRLLAPFTHAATRTIDLTITELTDKLQQIKQGENTESEEPTACDIMLEFGEKYETFMAGETNSSGQSASSHRKVEALEEAEIWLRKRWDNAQMTCGALQVWRQEAEAALSAFESIDSHLTSITEWVDKLPTGALSNVFRIRSAYRITTEREHTLHPLNKTSSWEWETLDLIVALKAHLNAYKGQESTSEDIACDAEMRKAKKALKRALKEAKAGKQWSDYLDIAGPILKSRIETLQILANDPDIRQADDCQAFQLTKLSQQTDRHDEYTQKISGELQSLNSLAEAVKALYGS